MKTIWKFSTPLSKLNDIIEIMMPPDAIVLSAVNQNESLCIYALVDIGDCTEKRLFRVAGTGHPVEHMHHGDFIGTVIFSGESLVFHVFDLGHS